MCSVACRNYCQFHLTLYDNNNSILFVLNSLVMYVIHICMFHGGVAWLVDGWGTLQIGIRASLLKTRCLGGVARQWCLMVGVHYKLVSKLVC
jgi:hypothetical protein